MSHNRQQRKKGPQNPQKFVWKINLKFQCKILSFRPLAMGDICDREEFAWVSLGKSYKFGDG